MGRTVPRRQRVQLSRVRDREDDGMRGNVPTKHCGRCETRVFEEPANLVALVKLVDGSGKVGACLRVVAGGEPEHEPAATL